MSSHFFYTMKPQKKDILTSNEYVFYLMRAKGVEPLHLAALDPKSSASANSATPANLILDYNNRKYRVRLVFFL